MATPEQNTVEEAQDNSSMRGMFRVRARRAVQGPVFARLTHTANLFLLGTQYRNWAPLVVHIWNGGRGQARSIITSIKRKT